MKQSLNVANEKLIVKSLGKTKKNLGGSSFTADRLSGYYGTAP